MWYNTLAMAQRKNERVQPASRLESVVSDALETESGALQPYIKVFRYNPENAAHESLGTLLGIFEVGDRSESSAYIVNFIASVAKKEYFSQPRRSPSDSLEATLHKINRALAEIVKHGNTEWLGTLHAVVCSLEKNAIHFSVTGGGNLLLIRNGIASDIGDGLASEEASSHPLKTFTDTAGGRLQENDIFVMTTSSLLEILPIEEIEKAARHFPGERFIQFLRTAIVNQLPIGGAFVINARKTTVTVPKKSPAPITTSRNLDDPIPNVFTQKIFSRTSKRKPDASHFRTTDARNPAEQFSPEKQSDYIDSQTGHIYVQGEVPTTPAPTSERREHLRMITEEWFFRLRRITRAGHHRIRTTTTNIFSASRIVLIRGGSVIVTSLKRTRMSHQSGIVSIPEPETTTTNRSEPDRNPIATETPPTGDTVLATEPPPVATRHIPIASTTSIRARMRAFTAQMKPLLKTAVRIFGSFWKHILGASQAIIARTTPSLRSLGTAIGEILIVFGRNTVTLFRSLEKKWQYLTIIGIATILLLGVWRFSFFEPESAPTPAKDTASEQTPAPSPIKNNESSPVSVTPLVEQSGIIQVIPIRGQILATTAESVLILTENGTPEEFPLPIGSGSVIHASAMPDISTLFILTEQGKVLSFSPTQHTFAENTIQLPPASDITTITSYTTYLYVLNIRGEQVQRYPRTGGGFGETVSWLKDPEFPFSEIRSITVSEKLYAASSDTIYALSRGKIDTSVSFQNSETPVEFSSITAVPEKNALAALDTSYGRIVLWNTESGRITKQYASEQLRQASGFAIEADRGRALFILPGGVSSLPIEF